jgi:formylglycine-generating enzyme required for sulfatase activity
MSLDLVMVPARVLEVGESLEDVKQTWRAHADLGLPWHYFAKQTGSRRVEVGDLRVQRSPLTWAELATVDSGLVGRLKDDAVGWDHPVDRLSWEEANVVARLLAEYHGLALRLPTEFEWERVARGDDDRRYPWGDDFDPACGNLAEAGVGQTEPVGSRPAGASQHGVLDLAGNADEWTASVYEPHPGAHWTVPLAELWSADPHVTRGGSFSHHRDLALARRRHAVYRPWEGAGLRLVTDGR